MLDRAGYADGDIDFGSNDLTRLPHLIVVGDIARVHGRTACAHGSTQLVSQRNDILLEGLAVLQCPADRKSVVSGKSVSVRVDLGCRRIIKKKTKKDNAT